MEQDGRGRGRVCTEKDAEPCRAQHGQQQPAMFELCLSQQSKQALPHIEGRLGGCRTGASPCRGPRPTAAAAVSRLATPCPAQPSPTDPQITLRLRCCVDCPQAAPG